jgi:hypothetical protein
VLDHAIGLGVYGLDLRCSMPSVRHAASKPSDVKQLPRSVGTWVTLMGCKAPLNTDKERMHHVIGAGKSPCVFQLRLHPSFEQAGTAKEVV